MLKKIIFLSNKKYSLRADKSFLFLIILTGTILRILLAINTQIWFDEALSIYIARVPVIKLLPFIIARSWEQQPLLYSLLLKLLLNFNLSELWLRMLSVCCGVAVIYMTYKLALLVFDKYVGLLSASLVAFNGTFLNYSCQLRVYMVWVLLSILSLYFLVKLIANPSRKNIIFHILFTALAIYAHYFGFFLLLAELLLLFLNKQSSKLNVRLRFLVLSCIIILVIPHVIYAFIKFKYFAIFGEYYAANNATPLTILSLFKEYSDYSGIFILYFSIISCVLIKKIKLNVFKGGLRGSLKQIINYVFFDLRMSLVFFYFFIPITIVFIISQYKYAVFHEYRFFLPFFIFYYFVIAWACSLSGERFKKWLFASLVLITFLNASHYSALAIKNSSSQSVSREFKKITKSLKSGLEKDDILAVSNIYKNAAIFNYVNRPIRIITSPQSIKKAFLLRSFSWQEDEIIKDFSMLKNEKRIWLITDKDVESSIEWFTKNPQVKLLEERNIDSSKLLLYRINN